MAEKYKIYLSEDTKVRLANDAELFEFTRNDGSVNLNGFLKELIVNYFEQYRNDNEELLNGLLEELRSAKGIKTGEASVLADRIIKTYINNRDASSGKSAVLTLTVSGASEEIINVIENNLLQESSLSGYIKDMFLSYLSMPRNKREEIIFARSYELINDAIAKGRKLSFSSGSDFKSTVEPYLIATSKEEQFSYLLCYDSKSRKNRSFRISRLKNLFITSDTFEKDKNVEDELIRKGLRSPHSMMPDIHATVRMTEHGKHMFKMIVKNRPYVTYIEGDLYHFDWPEMQLEDYFRRFGKDGIVVSPRSLRNKLKNYYSHALEAYEKK